MKIKLEKNKKILSILCLFSILLNFFSFFSFKASPSDAGVVILGNPGSGKTRLSDMLIYKKFDENYNSTPDVRLFSKKFNKVQLSICDASYNEDTEGLVSNYMKTAQYILVVFDLSNENNDIFEQFKKWKDFIEKTASRDVKIILVGNKLDLCTADKSKKLRILKNISKTYRYLAYCFISSKVYGDVSKIFNFIATDAVKSPTSHTETENLGIEINSLNFEEEVQSNPVKNVAIGTTAIASIILVARASKKAIKSERKIRHRKLDVLKLKDHEKEERKFRMR